MRSQINFEAGSPAAKLAVYKSRQLIRAIPKEPTMSKGKNSKKSDKRKPAMTPKEKKQAKREKKEKKDNPGLFTE
jgi:hypothetical protein